MLVNLDEYLKNLKCEKEEIERKNDEDAIQEKVLEFEEKVRKEYAEEKARKLSEKAIQISVLEDIAAKEREREEAIKNAEPSFRAEDMDCVAEPVIEMGAEEVGSSDAGIAAETAEAAELDNL